VLEDITVRFQRLLATSQWLDLTFLLSCWKVRPHLLRNCCMLSIVSQRLYTVISDHGLKGSITLRQERLRVVDGISMARCCLSAPALKGSTTSAMELLHVVDHLSMATYSRFWSHSGR